MSAAGQHTDSRVHHFIYRDPCDKALKISQVATLLGVHCHTVRRWARDGLLPVYRVTPERGDARFLLSDVTKMVRPDDKSG